MTISARRLYGKLYQLYLWLRYQLFQRHRMNHLVLESMGGIPLVILPDVFNPTMFVTGELFLEALRLEESLEGMRVLDMGTGSGVLGIAAAMRGASVVAVDANPSAVRCARINALLNEVTLDVRSSDLFSAVAGERFARILFSAPLFEGVPKSGLEMAFFASDIVERFCAGLEDHLVPSGYALLLASSTAGIDRLYAALDRHSLVCESVATRRQPSETYFIMRIRPVRTASASSLSDDGDMSIQE